MKKFLLATALVGVLSTPAFADEVLNGVVEVGVYIHTCGNFSIKPESDLKFAALLQTYPVDEVNNKFREVNASVQQIGLVRYCAAMNVNREFQDKLSDLGITRR